MRIAFLGLGLIGGSVARAIRAAPAYRGATVAAWTPSGRGPGAARRAGIVDEVADDPAAAVRGADLVVLAAPPLACVGLLSGLAAPLREGLAPGATVTDVASTKWQLTRAATASGVPFVGGHPMAGRETSGFGAGDPTLFEGRPWVITEAVAGGDPRAVRTLAEACGAVPVELAAERHDRLVAAISHLPLVTSVALVEAVTGGPEGADPDWPAAARLAASGWRDTTRLARGSAAMGAEIAASNAPILAELLRRYRDRIDAWIEELGTGEPVDPEALRRRFDLARRALEDEPHG